MKIFDLKGFECYGYSAGKAAIVDEGDTSLPAEHHAVKRRPPLTTPRSSKKKKQGVAGQTPEAEAATRAREERRAIAREYMQLQKHSRRIWNAQAKSNLNLSKTNDSSNSR
ncbi:hypothetical protein GQ600_26686 [Phytophthora cactorum]|nr:hypothetical protein GQ600_26686 [Phytophthora cactorum]